MLSSEFFNEVDERARGARITQQTQKNTRAQSTLEFL
jgi:hypothetical protein